MMQLSQMAKLTWLPQLARMAKLAEMTQLTEMIKPAQVTRLGQSSWKSCWRVVKWKISYSFRVRMSAVVIDEQIKSFGYM